MVQTNLYNWIICSTLSVGHLFYVFGSHFATSAIVNGTTYEILDEPENRCISSCTKKEKSGYLYDTSLNKKLIIKIDVIINR